jgi:hypothetical protein
VTTAHDDRTRSRAVLLIDASNSGVIAGRAGLDTESGAGGDHRCLAGVDGGDDLGVIDHPNLAVLPFDESGTDGRALLPHRSSPARGRIADPQYARDPCIPIFWSSA